MTAKEIGNLVLGMKITHGFLQVMLLVTLKIHGQMVQVTGLLHKAMLMDHGLIKVLMLIITTNTLDLEMTMVILILVLKAAILGHK